MCVSFHDRFYDLWLFFSPGHPNVGKSSLMNGLIGRKVVSTSVTPGHTKYFQTYFLTKTVKLCDSPGLVFPSLIPKQLQASSGKSLIWTYKGKNNLRLQNINLSVYDVLNYSNNSIEYIKF